MRRGCAPQLEGPTPARLALAWCRVTEASRSSFPRGRSPGPPERQEEYDDPDFKAQADEADQQELTQSVRSVSVPWPRAPVSCLPAVEVRLLYQHEPEADREAR